MIAGDIGRIDVLILGAGVDPQRLSVQDVENRILPKPFAHHPAEPAYQPARGILAHELFRQELVKPVAGIRSGFMLAVSRLKRRSSARG